MSNALTKYIPKSRFNTGDNVFTVYGNKLRHTIIVGVMIEKTNNNGLLNSTKYRVLYKLKGIYSSYKQEKVFATTKEAIKYIGDNIVDLT